MKIVATLNPVDEITFAASEVTIIGEEAIEWGSTIVFAGLALICVVGVLRFMLWNRS